VHVGDFTASSVLEELRELGPVEAVHGNMDEPALRRALPERAIVDAERMRIGLVHDAGPTSGRHERLAGRFGGCDLIAYGHSHVPELARAGETWIVNPGSPTERRRAPSHTMVVVSAGVPELVHLD
jgi:putative phosphoesterase